MRFTWTVFEFSCKLCASGDDRSKYRCSRFLSRGVRIWINHVILFSGAPISLSHRSFLFRAAALPKSHSNDSAMPTDVRKRSALPSGF